MPRTAPIHIDDLRPPLGATRRMQDITAQDMIMGRAIPRSVPMSAAPVFPGQQRPPMPTAAPQMPVARPPMPQRQPTPQARPAAAPSMAAAAPAAGGGLLNPNVGAGLLGAASKIGGGPTRLPVSLGSQIGPALNQFAADYQASQLAAEKKAREQALINKYGPEALVPGALSKILEIEGEQAALKTRAQAAQNLFGPVASSAPQGASAQAAAVAQQGPSAVSTAQGATASAAATTNMPQVDPRLGIVLTQGRQAGLRAAYMKGDKEFGDALRAYQKEDQDLVKDARDRLKPAIKEVQETSTKIGIIERSLLAAASGQRGTADISAVNAFQRLVDDGVVRGEDIALQASATGWYTQLITWSQKAKTGDLLDNSIRARMIETAKQIAAARYATFQTTVAAQKELSIANNVPWEKVFASQSMKRFLDPVAKMPVADLTKPRKGEARGPNEISIIQPPSPVNVTTPPDQ